MRLPLLLSLLLACALPAAAAESDPQAAKALHGLFDRSWQAVAERFPEFGTYRGDYRNNDRLVDVSPAAQAGRDRAMARLGARFDIRKFHNAVIDNGAPPLSTLETLIDEWIEQQAKAS